MTDAYPQINSSSSETTVSSQDAYDLLNSHLNEDNFKRNIYTDVEILVEDQIFKSHRSILSRRSPYLRKKLLYENGTPKESMIYVPDIRKDEFEILLNYMNSGYIDWTCGNFFEIYKAAAILEMQDVMEKCLKLLEPSKDEIKNCFYCLVAARKLDNPAVYTKALKFLTHRFEETVSCPEFLKLDTGSVLDLLSSETMGARSEFIVFLAALKWLNYDYQGRCNDAVEVMESVRFSSMSMKEILACYQPPIMKRLLKIPEIKRLILSANGYITAKFHSQENLFKEYECQPRHFTCGALPILLWPQQQSSEFETNMENARIQEEGSNPNINEKFIKKDHRRIMQAKEAIQPSKKFPAAKKDLERERPFFDRYQSPHLDVRNTRVKNLIETGKKYNKRTPKTISPKQAPIKIHEEDSSQQLEFFEDNITAKPIRTEMATEGLKEAVPYENSLMDCIRIKRQPRSSQSQIHKTGEQIPLKNIVKQKFGKIKVSPPKNFPKTTPERLKRKTGAYKNSVPDHLDFKNYPRMSQSQIHKSGEQIPFRFVKNKSPKYRRNEISSSESISKMIPPSVIFTDDGPSYVLRPPRENVSMDQQLKDIEEIESRLSIRLSPKYTDEKDSGNPVENDRKLISQVSSNLIFDPSYFDLANTDPLSRRDHDFMRHEAQNHFNRHEAQNIEKRAIRGLPSETSSIAAMPEMSSQAKGNAGILVIGGINPKHPQTSVTGSVILNFDLDKNKWIRYGTLPEPRHNHCAAICNNILYVIGGCDPNDTLHKNRCTAKSSCFKLDLNTKKWTAIKKMGFKRHEFGIATYGHYIYAVGGQSETQKLLKSVEVYDTMKNKWQSLSGSMCCGRKAMGVTTYEHKLWVVGGVIQADSQSALEVIPHVDCYDIKLKSWSFYLNYLPSPRCYCSVVSWRNTLYCIGGMISLASDIMSATDEVLSFSAEDKVWREEPRLPVPRAGCVAVVQRDYLYVIGGYDPDSDKAILPVNFLSPGALSWGKTTSLPTHMFGFYAVGCTTN